MKTFQKLQVMPNLLQHSKQLNSIKSKVKLYKSMGNRRQGKSEANRMSLLLYKYQTKVILVRV